jgi:myo-inositol-1(or 4)-monophosphatase
MLGDFWGISIFSLEKDGFAVFSKPCSIGTSINFENRMANKKPDARPYLKFALDLADKMGQIQKKKWGSKLDIRFKSPTNPVTEVDHACEALALKAIRKAFPSHSILGEETGGHGAKDLSQAEFLWIIDPLDGTVNYSHALPQFSVSIGLRHRQEALCGVVHAAVQGETFSAGRGLGARLNNKPIRVSPQREPKESLFVSGFAYQSAKTGENLPEWMLFMRAYQALRRLGCASLDYSWVACGRFEGFWEYGLKAWDNAAGELIVREAGGKVTDLQGKPFDVFGNSVLATNSVLHKHCLSTLSKARKVVLAWPPKA